MEESFCTSELLQSTRPKPWQPAASIISFWETRVYLNVTCLCHESPDERHADPGPHLAKQPSGKVVRHDGKEGVEKDEEGWDHRKGQLSLGDLRKLESRRACEGLFSRIGMNESRAARWV